MLDHSLSRLVLLLGVAEVLAERLDAIFEWAIPVGPRGRTKTLVATEEHLELTTVAEASSSHSEVFHETEVLDLVTDYTLIEDI